MTRPLTDEQRDKRKWEASLAYVAAWSDYKAIERRYGLPSNEANNAWRYLMQARRKYLYYAKH